MATAKRPKATAKVPSFRFADMQTRIFFNDDTGDAAGSVVWDVERPTFCVNDSIITFTAYQLEEIVAFMKSRQPKP